MAGSGLISTFSNIASSNAIPLTAIQAGEQEYTTISNAVTKALSEHTVAIVIGLISFGVITVGGVLYIKHRKAKKRLSR